MPLQPRFVLAAAACGLLLAAATLKEQAAPAADRAPRMLAETLAATPALAGDALAEAREAFEPALCIGGDGAAWLAWIALDASGSHAGLRVARAAFGEPGAPLVPCAPARHSAPLAEECAAFAAPALAPWGPGAYLVFEAERAGRRTLLGCVLEPGEGADAAPRAGALEVLPGGEGGLLPALARGADGKLAAVWMRPTVRGYRIALALRGAGGWSESREVAAELGGPDRDDWCPRLAAEPAGGYALVWDSFDGLGFDVWAAELESDGAPRSCFELTHGSGYEGLPDVAVDASGTWWVAFETAKEFGEWRGLRAERHVVLLRVDPRGLPGARVACDCGSAGRGESPRVASGAAGPLLTFRRPIAVPDDFGGRTQLYVALETVALRFAATGTPEDLAITGSQGDAQASEVLATLPGGAAVLALFAADDRLAALRQPGGYTVPIEGPWRLACALLPSSLGAPAPHGDPTPEPERAARPALRLAGDGEAPHTLLGDLHRHTTASRCSGLTDGTFLDALRYARGPGGLDFLAVTDHYQALGRASWWRQMRDVARFDDPARTAVLAGIEINVSRAGHQNLVLAQPTAATLDDLARDARTTDALKQRFPEALAIPHMTAARMNQFPPQALDADFHRAIEIYQGLRGSYEGRGLPLEADDLSAGPSSVAALLPHFPVGLVASSDHGSSGAAFAGVHARGRDAASVWAALASGACFAANAAVDVDLALDGLSMGSGGPARAEAPVVLRVPARAPRGDAPPAPIAYVELVKNGETLERRAGSGARELCLLSSEGRGVSPSRALEVRARGARLAGVSQRVPGECGTEYRFFEDSQGDGVLLFEGARLRAELVLELELQPPAAAAALAVEPAIEFRFNGQSGELALGDCLPGRSAALQGVISVAPRVWRIGSPLGVPAGEFEFADPARAAGDVYWARVAWEDGALAWTSPIRVAEVR